MKRLRILVADDHKAMRDRVVQHLENDFEVVSAVGDGYAVLEAESTMQPDVCVLDISMPELSGMEAAAELKRRCSASMIIFLTAHQDPDFLEAALESGAVGFVIKSRMGTDLIPAINAAISKRLFISPTCNFPERNRTNDQLRMRLQIGDSQQDKTVSLRREA